MNEKELIDHIHTLVAGNTQVCTRVRSILITALAECREYNYEGLEPYPFEDAMQFVKTLNGDTGSHCWNKVALIKAIRQFNGASLHQGAAMADEIMRRYNNTIVPTISKFRHAEYPKTITVKSEQ